MPCIEIIGDHYTVNYQIWFDDCPVETKFVSEQRLQGSRGKLCLVYLRRLSFSDVNFSPKAKGTIPNVAQFTMSNEWPSAFPINVHINLVSPGTGLCVASGLIFTYTPVYIEGRI